MAESDVRWEVLRLDGIRHLLRNVGTDEACNVDITSNDDSVSRVGDGRTVFPGGAVLFDVNSSPATRVALKVSWETTDGEDRSEEVFLA